MSPEEHALALPRYKDWAPTPLDAKGLNLPDKQEWLVCPVMRTRDSGPLDESNFQSALKALEACGEDACAVGRFGHWGPGWFEILLVNPDNAPAVRELGEIVCSLAAYPILDEHDFSEREQLEADRVWKEGYSTAQRIEYIRENRSQFEFRSLADMLGCVRGHYFAGYASELIY